MKLAFRILMVVGLTVALLIPISMIRGTVSDRQQHRAAAVAEVSRSTAGAQALAGPVLFVPYSDRKMRRELDARGVERSVEEVTNGTWVFFPESLDAGATLRALPRKLGLHVVRVFELDTTVRATFRVQLPQPTAALTTRTLGRPSLGVAIADVRGLVGVPTLRVGGASLRLEQGLGPGDASGLHATLPSPHPQAPFALDVEFKATLQGTETVSIAPLAGRNVITLDSAWPHPRFHGDFLPRSRSVRADGFSARWEVSSLASNAQAQFRTAVQGDGQEQPTDTVSVSLVDPVDVYTQVDRATKYGVLFVLLTFVAFFMFELLRELRIHPIQYALVGLALAIFFLLLLALSEHIAFGLAYLVAAVACVALIGHYLSRVLGGWVRGAGFAAMLGTLYAALYGLLLSEDNAMVLGAGLLFAILAGIMVLTRNVDWYRAATT